MGFLDDVTGAYRQFSAWLESVAEGARAWAASDQGQDTMAAMDFFSISGKVGDYFAHVGWYLPIHPALHRYVMEHVEWHAPFDERDAARLVGPGSAHWDWIVEGMRRSPSLKTRLPVVEDAVFCIEHGRWHAAVTTLLPVIEGVVSDRAGVLSGKRVGRRFHDLIHSESADLDLVAMAAMRSLRVLDAELFASREFDAVEIGETALNRHLILHGRTAAFGTRTNACRVFMILVALIELLDGPLIARVDSAPPDEGSLLDDYGPLSGLRAAAAARSEVPASSSDPQSHRSAV